MKRVGNKPGQLVRSASRRKKSSSRFQFDITIESVTGLKPASTYFVKWTRGIKNASTSHFETSKETSVTVNEKLPLLVTLYRDDAKKFDSKEAKLSIVYVNKQKKQERTAAKTKFDLSPFAGVPSASTSHVLKLSDRITVKVTIDSRFLKSGGSGPGSAGTSSALSSIDGASVRSSDDEHDDFGDLALDDIPDPETTTSMTASDVSSSSNGTASFTSSSVSRRHKSELTSSNLPVTQSNATSSSIQPQQPPSFSSKSSRNSINSVNLDNEVSTLKKENERLLNSIKQYDKSTSELKMENDRLTNRVTQAEKRKENEEKSLKRENDRLSATLKDIQRSKTSADTSVKLQIDSLTSRLDERASQLEDTLSERDAARKEVEMLTQERNKARMELNAARKESHGMREEKNQIDNLTAERDEALQTVKEFRSELTVARRSLEEFRLRCKRLEGAEERCTELSREIDRLTVASATGGSELDENSQQNAAIVEIENRLSVLQEEKEGLARKLRSHEQHAAKVRATYEELSLMYSSLREDHTTLQKEASELKKYNEEARSSMDSNSTQKEEVDKLTKTITHLESSKESLQSDYDQVLGQIDTLQDRLDSTTQSLARAQREVEESAKEQEELKRQRDSAMQKALAKNKEKPPSQANGSGISAEELEEIKLNSKTVEEERNNLLSSFEDLKKEIGDLKDDIEYEKSEKSKAREERDKIRENARALEKRTSQAARTTDALHSLKRELSSQQMRVQDYESIVTELKSENEDLKNQIGQLQSGPQHATRGTSKDDIADLLDELVHAKLAVAEAKGEQQQMEFEMKQLKKDERGMQQRLAAKASRLEVRLEESTQEIERLRRLVNRSTTDYSRSHDAREFNELGSDVDY